ncbi:hypothetical protein DW069_25070 [Bacteroides thetaiotaomicron]|nr:hypothetical protein DW069_25070 [Bacteroides thetaiotaomicron]
MCLVFVEADYLVAVTYNMFYDFDDVLSFSKFFVKEEAPVMCLVFVEADYLVAVTYNMFYDFDDVLSFSKFFVKEHFSTK